MIPLFCFTHEQITKPPSKLDQYRQGYPDPHNDTVVLPSKEAMQKMDQGALGDLYHRSVSTGSGSHWLCCDMIYSYTLSCRVIAKVKKWSQSVTESRLGFIDYVIYVMIYSNFIIHYTTGITKIKKCHNIWLLFSNKSWMSWEDYQI